MQDSIATSMTYLLKIFCFLTRPTEYQTCKNVFFTPFANLGQIFLGNESGEFSRVNDIHPVSFVLVGGCQIYSALKVKNPTPLLPFPLFSPRFPTSIITLILEPTFSASYPHNCSHRETYNIMHSLERMSGREGNRNTCPCTWR